MANQRAKNVKRVTLTLPDELLRSIEAESKKSGKNRLDLIREALQSKIGNNTDKKSSK